MWSDHAPVFLVMVMSSGTTTRGTWILNDDLLYDEICMSEIRLAIKIFVIDHVKDTTSLSIQWETLKCVLRGLFIKHGTRLKKRKRERINSTFKRYSKTGKIA